MGWGERLQVWRLRARLIQAEWIDLDPSQRRSYLRHYLRLARGKLARAAQRWTGAAPEDRYRAWQRENAVPATQLRRQRLLAAARVRPTRFSFVIPVWRPPADALTALVRSLAAQSYPHWEAVLADAAPEDPAATADARRWTVRDARFRWLTLPRNGGISANTEAAVAQASGDWLVPVDHDDEVAPDLLWHLDAALQAQPQSEVIVFDEDKISADGRRHYDPWCKPPRLNPALALSTNPLLHAAWRAATWRRLGGLDPAVDGAQDWDLALRALRAGAPVAHLPRFLYHWRAVPGSAASDPNAKPWARPAQVEALVRHLRATGLAFTAVTSEPDGSARIRWATPGQTLVSILIPTRNHAALLDRCLTAIVERTAGVPWEVIVIDTGSDQPEALAVLDRWSRHPQVRVRYDLRQPFNWSAVNHRAVSEARGNLLLFLNDDTAPLDPDWLAELVGWVAQPGVAAAGARLERPDGSLQHAGIALGLAGQASHWFDGAPGPTYGPFGSSEWARDCLALTGACLLVRRDAYEAVGGFDAVYELTGSDMELGLRLAARGLRSVYAPRSRVLHEEGASRGRRVPPWDALRFEAHRQLAGVATDPWLPAALDPGSRVPRLRLRRDLSAADLLARIWTWLEVATADWAAAPPPDGAWEAFRPQPAPVSAAAPRVLVVSPDFSNSGAPRMLESALSALTARGCTVQVLAAEDGPLRARWQAAGWNPVVAPEGRRLLDDARSTLPWLATADAVLLNTLRPWRCALAARAAGRPLVWWLHEGTLLEEEVQRQPGLAAALRSGADVVVPFQAAGARLRRLAPHSVVQVDPYRIPDAAIANGDRQTTAPVVACLGSWESRKGQDVLLDAWSRLTPAERAGHRLELAGRPLRRGFARDLQRMAKRTPAVQCRPELRAEEALQFLGRAALVVLPSRDEALPLVLLEAMALGRPVVASDVGGVAEAIRDGLEGRIVPAGDPAALASALREALAEPSRRAEWGRAARRRYEINHQADRPPAAADRIWAALASRGCGVLPGRGPEPETRSTAPRATARE